MATSAEELGKAATLETYAAEQVEAAIGEGKEGGSPFSIGLLLEAAQKERESLDAIEESLETIRLSLAHRRRAIDQQEEALRDLSESLRNERS